MKKAIFTSISLMLLTSTINAGYSPWFTGPLLAPEGKAIPRGHINFEIYGSALDADGEFNRYSQLTHNPTGKNQSVTPLITLGLTDHINIELIQPYSWNQFINKSKQGISDFQSVFGYWLIKQGDALWCPDVYITYNQIVPLGKYQNLNPNYANVDATSSGSYQSGVTFNFQHLMPVFKDYYLRSRLSLQYLHPLATDVHGFNAYGGGYGTDGRIKPGDVSSATLAGEFSITQNWVAVMEAQAQYRQASEFKGRSGVTAAGQPASVGHGNINYISLAPAIEYNFNEHYGIIAGVWFSIKGKNEDNFRDLMVAFNAYF